MGTWLLLSSEHFKPKDLLLWNFRIERNLTDNTVHRLHVQNKERIERLNDMVMVTQIVALSTRLAIRLLVIFIFRVIKIGRLPERLDGKAKVPQVWPANDQFPDFSLYNSLHLTL